MERENSHYIYMAPMEGITTSTYRDVFKRHFAGVDLFYTPFLSLNHTHKFKTREKREFIPYQDDLVPQVLTNSSEDYIWAAGELKEAGYKRININMGCPSSTVVTKNKGAGMLLDTDRLRKFFDDIFENTKAHDLPDISIKTRIGMEDVAETEKLAHIYASYPFYEIIIHPRLRSDFYNGSVRLDSFATMAEIIAEKRPETEIVYNGDIFTPEDAFKIFEKFPMTRGVMLGRGMVANPALAAEIKGQVTNPALAAEIKGWVTNPAPTAKKTSPEDICSFAKELYEAYSEILSGERDVLFKMKDVAMYMAIRLPDDAKAKKAIKRAKNKSEILSAIAMIV